MSKERNIDELDRDILALLLENGRLPNAEIGRRVGLATSAVHERVRKMEQAGVIRGYRADVDPEALGLGLTAFVGVRLRPHREAQRVARDLTTVSGVEEIHNMAGEECFQVKVRCRDTAELERVLVDINEIESVYATRTSIALRPVLEATGAGRIPRE